MEAIFIVLLIVAILFAIIILTRDSKRKQWVCGCPGCQGPDSCPGCDRCVMCPYCQGPRGCLGCPKCRQFRKLF